ncbi:MAG: polyprenyl synthetase family protein [Dehalococcoidia bacterium]
MKTEVIYQPILEELHQVEKSLKSIAQVEFISLRELLGHTLNSSGKRTRPAITLLSSKFHAHDPTLPILMATAVELLHLASLIHDDTVDGASTRRGRPTINSKWGDNIAVLLGDYAFAKSATLVCDTNNVRVIRLFAQTIMSLSSGELKEQFHAYDWTLTRQQYWDRIYDKTASLFTTAAESGAILSGGSEPFIQSMRTYGEKLGMAFQIVDDILDFQGTEKKVGKPVGSDLIQGTLTLPSLLLMEHYPKDNSIKDIFQNRDREANLKKAIEMINDSSIISEAYSIAARFCDEARELIKDLPENAYSRSLAELSGYVLERNK